MSQRKRLLKIIIPIVAVTCTVIFVPWGLLWAWIIPLPDTVQEQVEDALNLDLDGVIVYVDKAGESPMYYAAGIQNKADNTPMDPQALFKIASISKLYVATAVAKLVHKKRLSLDDSLSDLLPALDGRIEHADRITLRMMAQHRSGIPNFTDAPKWSWWAPAENIEALKLILDQPADFEPDSRYRYSNTNYLIIGNILDKVLGYSHHRFINEEILKPLGLTHTYNLLAEADYQEVVSGYDYQGIYEYDGDLKQLDHVNPSGSMVATAEDVGIFLRALNDGSLLNDEEQAIYSSIYLYEHTGLLPGYQSIARYHKDIDTVVILFINTSGGLAWSYAEIVYGRIVKLVTRN